MGEEVWDTLREFRFPVGPEHQQRLEELAQELGIQTPWKT